MPIYNFICTTQSCTKLDQSVERLVKSADTIPPCATCTNPLSKQFSSIGTGLKFNGSGWYTNDYKRR
jgi:predicted nucleic acid-binding Zn ribbon protein